jgi:2-iminobutanoate/2-iminopropanoate deaminase
MEKIAIETDNVYSPMGAYSHAIRRGNLLFLSGKQPLDSGGDVVGKGDPAIQCQKVMENLQAVLEASGASWDNVVKTTVFVTDMRVLDALAEAKRRFISPPYPASTTVQVTRLAKPDALVEIEAIAVLE